MPEELIKLWGEPIPRELPLDAYHTDRGYLLSFNFNKHKNTGVKTIQHKGKTLLEVVV